MGLDNGIYVIKKKFSNDESNRYMKIFDRGLGVECGTIPDAKYSDDYPMTHYVGFEFMEAIYHRKDWGWRNMIVSNLKAKYTFCDDQCEWIIDKDDIDMIIQTNKYFDSRKIWESEGESIWDYKEAGIHKKLQDEIKILTALKGFIENNPDGAVMFYDSY